MKQKALFSVFYSILLRSQRESFAYKKKHRLMRSMESSPRHSSHLDNTVTAKSWPSRVKFRQQLEEVRASLIPYLITHRNGVIFGFVLMALLLEVIEHLIFVNYGEQIHLIYDIIIYTFIFPAVVWVMIGLLQSTEVQREKADQANGLRSEFSHKIGDVRNWEELTRMIVEFAHQVAPKAKATLYVLNAETMHMRGEAECDTSGLVTLQHKINISPDSLPLGSLPQLLMQDGASGMGLSAASLIATYPDGQNEPPLTTASQKRLNRFDLPITRNNQPIGFLKMEYPLGVKPSEEEMNALRSTEPVIALALEGVQLQNLALEQAAYTETQRQQIAQNLHDSLAQNISYLRLKLDQLTGENAIHEINVVLQELERMRTSADEAYQQVRNTLDELNPTRADDLVTSLLKQARIICQRSSLTLRSSQLGTPYTLPPAVRQQVIYITREALHNVEKHAFAHQVHLQFLWLEGELILKITDDGVGFNPISITAEGHYGLWIMQHRAEEIGGALKITSLDMQEEGATGTEVTLWIPRSFTPPDQNDLFDNQAT